MIGRRLVAGTVVVAAVVAGGVAGALIGIPGQSGAQTSSTSTPTTPESSEAPEGRGFGRHMGPFIGAGREGLDAAAEALGLSTAELLTKLRDGETTIADVAEEQNVDVQTVIDAMVAAATSDITDMVNNPLPTRPRLGGGFKGGPGLGFHFGFGGLGNKIDAAAQALGITEDELRTELRSGKSIAEVAKAKNVDVSKVVDAIVSDAEAKLDQAVTDGNLTQEQATELKTKLKDLVTRLVNNARPSGEGRFRFGGDGPGFGFGQWEKEAEQS